MLWLIAFGVLFSISIVVAIGIYAGAKVIGAVSTVAAELNER